MSDDLERQLSEAREGLHRTDPQRREQIAESVLAGAPAAPALEAPPGPRPRRRRRWFVAGVAVALVAGGAALASARLGLFSETPPPDVARAFLLAGGDPAANSPRGTTSVRPPATSPAARLVVADTPWGRFTYWRGADQTGRTLDLLQDPSGGFAGGGACLAFDPVLPPIAKPRGATAPASGDVALCGSSAINPGTTPTVIRGAVSGRVASAEIAYADGRRMPAFVDNRSLLVIVPPQSCRYGLEPPTELVLRDAEGHQVDDVPLGTRGFDLGGWEWNGPPRCGPSSGTSTPVAELFSVLTRPHEPTDDLPAALQTSGPQHVRPGSARLLGTRTGRRFYLATGRPYPAAPPTVCLIDVTEGARLTIAKEKGFRFGPGGAAGSFCPPAKAFADSFPVSVLSLAANHTATVAALVPDGYETLGVGGRQMPVQDNLVVLEGLHLGTRLELTGPAGARELVFGGYTGSLPPPDRRVVAP